MTTTAIVTGAGSGFGLAVTRALAARGTTVIACARDAGRLRAATDESPGVRAVPGDITVAADRAAIVAAGVATGRIDLLVHNAGELGPSPLPHLADYPADALRTVLETTLLAPLALTQLALPSLRAARGTVVALSSDAAVEAYPGWGGYGAAKAALDHLAAVLAVEEPDLAVYAFDPGDMRTAMHQRAFASESSTLLMCQPASGSSSTAAPPTTSARASPSTISSPTSAPGRDRTTAPSSPN